MFINGKYNNLSCYTTCQTLNYFAFTGINVGFCLKSVNFRQEFSRFQGFNE